MYAVPLLYIHPADGRRMTLSIALTAPELLSCGADYARSKVHAGNGHKTLRYASVAHDVRP